jgi:hypothetical protein
MFNATLARCRVEEVLFPGPLATRYLRTAVALLVLLGFAKLAMAQCVAPGSAAPASPCNTNPRYIVLNCALPGHSGCPCHVLWDVILYKEVCLDVAAGYNECEVENVATYVSCTQHHQSRLFWWDDCTPATPASYPGANVSCDKVTKLTGTCPG